MHTTAFWLTVPEPIVQRQAVERPLVIDAMRGIAHALHTVACVGLMSDPSDLGHSIGDKAEPHGSQGAHAPPAVPGFDPTIFLYDRIPGGVGLAPRVFDAREELVRRARALIERCPCADGCPACVGPVLGATDALSEVRDSRKRISLALLVDLGVAGTH
jgi:DEAD/DEAH box helicase domain-containing protein